MKRHRLFTLRSYLLCCMLLLLGLTVCIPSHNIHAATEYYPRVQVELDGENVYFNQQDAINVNGNIMVPMKELFQKLGAVIQWDSAAKTIHAKKDNTSITITINKNTAVVNGKTITLSAAAKVINGATMVPLRFVSEALGAKVYWYNEVSTAVIVSERKAAPVITLQPSDYTLIYETKESLKELSEIIKKPTILGYELHFDEYIKRHYPNTAYLRALEYSGLERSKGFTAKDIYTGSKHSLSEIQNYHKFDDSNSKRFDNDVDHYFSLFDKNNEYIATLHIFNETPKEHILDGYIINEKFDLKKIATSEAKLHNVVFKPIMKWDYAAVDHSIHKDKLKNKYEYDTSFRSELNHYIGYYSPAANKQSEYTLQLDFFRGMEVNIEAQYNKNKQGVKLDYEIGYQSDKELKISIDPKKADEVILRINVRNPINFTRSYYTLELKELPHINSLLTFQPDYIYVSDFLPNDKFIIEIPGTLTTSGKAITINERIKSQSYYIYEDYAKGTMLKTSSVKDKIKVKVVRGNKTVYNTDYIYSTHNVPILKASDFKYETTPYTQKELLDKKLVSSYPNMFGGRIDLSGNKNVAYAQQFFSMPDWMNSYQFMHTGYLESADNLEYRFGMLVTVKSNEKYKLSRNQTIYFMLYDQNRYPIGLLPITIQLKEGYIHSKGQIVN